MRQQSVHPQFATSLVVLGYVCATGMAGCAWDEFKERGYGVLQEHQTQRCLEDPSRQSSDCVNHQSYDSYERERSAPSSSPSRVP